MASNIVIPNEKISDLNLIIFLGRLFTNLYMETKLFIISTIMLQAKDKLVIVELELFESLTYLVGKHRKGPF
jgi:hypothetical protein